MEYKYTTLTTAADQTGSATISINKPVFLYGIDYIKTDYADGVDLTVTTSNSVLSKTLLVVTNMNAAVRIFLRDNSTGATGTASTDGLIIPPIFGDITFTIAQGGAVKTGAFVVWYFD